MSHSQTLRRVSQEYVIDLYLRPPVSRFRLMDFHLMDRIVRDANRSVLQSLPLVSPSFTSPPAQARCQARADLWLVHVLMTA